MVKNILKNVVAVPVFLAAWLLGAPIKVTQPNGSAKSYRWFKRIK